MHDESHDTSKGGHSALPPTNVTALLTRMLLSGLEGAGYTRTAKLVKEWPELIGKGIGGQIKRIADKRARGEQVSDDDKAELKKEIESNPKEATLLLGPLLASSLEGTISAEEEKERILGTYEFALNSICGYMEQAQTSLLLQGFIHGSDLLSYWHLKSNTPKFVRSKIGNLHLNPSGLDVYFWSVLPETDLMDEGNALIRRDPARHLPTNLYDYEHNDGVAKLESIEEFTVSIKQLHPEREELMQKETGTFTSSWTYKYPVDFTIDIPFGPQALEEMFDSYIRAKDVQQKPLTELETVKQRLEEKLNPKAPSA